MRSGELQKIRLGILDRIQKEGRLFFRQRLAFLRGMSLLCGAGQGLAAIDPFSQADAGSCLTNM